MMIQFLNYEYTDVRVFGIEWGIYPVYTGRMTLKSAFTPTGNASSSLPKSQSTIEIRLLFSLSLCLCNKILLHIKFNEEEGLMRHF